MKQTSCDPLFVFAGGGTGGHIFPGLAVAESLMDALPQSRILFLSTGRPVEDRIFAGADFETLLTPAIRMRDMIRHPMRFVAAFVKATSIAKRIIREQQPAAIIGLGGVASVPLIRVAKKTPVVLLEQNVLPGRTTRWLAKRHAVMLSFNRTRAWLPNSDQHIVTGNPVQKSIQALVQPASDGRSTKSRQTLLVLGGSQGSQQVNAAVIAAVTALRSEFGAWKILHQTGAEDCERTRRAYQDLGIDHDVQEFFTDMGSIYRQATLAICRSGATTLAELALSGVPSIFIPYPNAKDDHQTLNARHFVDAQAALMVDSQDRSQVPAALQEALTTVIGNVNTLPSMRQKMLAEGIPDAAKNVAREILNRIQLPEGTTLDSTND